MTFSAYQIRDRGPATSKKHNIVDKISFESVVIKDSEMHAGNSMRISAVLTLFAAAVQFTHVYIPPDILRAISVSLILVFSPYYIGLFTILLAVIGTVFFSVLTVCAMLLAGAVFGSCAACVVFLVAYVLFEVDILVDPVIASVRGAYEFLGNLYDFLY